MGSSGGGSIGSATGVGALIGGTRAGDGAGVGSGRTWLGTGLASMLGGGWTKSGAAGSAATGSSGSGASSSGTPMGPRGSGLSGMRDGTGSDARDAATKPGVAARIGMGMGWLTRTIAGGLGPDDLGTWVGIGGAATVTATLGGASGLAWTTVCTSSSMPKSAGDIDGDDGLRATRVGAASSNSLAKASSSDIATGIVWLPASSSNGSSSVCGLSFRSRTFANSAATGHPAEGRPDEHDRHRNWTGSTSW